MGLFHFHVGNDPLHLLFLNLGYTACFSIFFASDALHNGFISYWSDFLIFLLIFSTCIA